MSDAAPLLRADDVTVTLGGHAIVSAASLSLRAGELAVLIGPNGAGKTTLVRALAGLLPCEGRIELEGRPLDAWTSRERARRIGYLPQGATFHWPMTVEAVVALGRYPHGDPFSPPTQDDIVAVRDALAATSTDSLAHRSVMSLSGGERARVALARVLATQAEILLADEPMTSLDARHQLVVMQLLRDAAHAGRAVLAVVHDLSFAARFADRVIVIAGGHIAAQGTPDETLDPARIGDVFGVEIETVRFGDQRVLFARRPI